MKDRFKEARKSLNLTQDDFAARLGLTRGAITNVELGKVDPKPKFIDLVCRTFGINEIWLRTGIGEMFAPMTEQEELASAVGRLLRDDGDEYKRQLILAISDLQPETIKDIVKTLKQRFGGSSEEK